LKVEGAKLTGTLSTPRRGGEMADTAISEGKVNGAELSFTVTREFNGNTFSSKYAGKLSGDTIKGKIDSERNGESQSRDWVAHRQTDKAKSEEAKPK
jgi:hypothetical protein